MTPSVAGGLSRQIRYAVSEIEDHARANIGGPELIADTAGRLAAQMASLVVIIIERPWAPEIRESIVRLDALISVTNGAETPDQLRDAVAAFRAQIHDLIVPF